MARRLEHVGHRHAQLRTTQRARSLGVSRRRLSRRPLDRNTALHSRHSFRPSAISRRGRRSRRDGRRLPVQISIWEWTGAELVSQFIGLATGSFEPAGKLEITGSLIRIPSDEPFKALSACGQCKHLQSVWTLDVSGDGVRDLGRTPLAPELAAADDLMDRVRKGTPTSDFAAPAVVAALSDELRGVEWLGFFTSTLERSPKGNVICINADGLRVIKLTFARVDGRLFATDSWIADDGLDQPKTSSCAP